ncbi:MAG: uracil-DNA glycosylase [Anaerolineae bacterium]|nr:uracil-DNA glycosylase [Anaerolineae bacterium]
MTADKTEALRQIRDEILNLTQSPLYAFRVQNDYFPVIGQGSHEARIMFIGEAPGENEAKSGRPFVGASGKLLDKLLESIQLAREDVYITNIVKDRPPDNRDPTREEIALYAPFLVRQVDILRPQVIATLGRFSMEFILTLYDAPEKKQKISALHGKVLHLNTAYGTVALTPLFHPATALYKGDLKDTLFEDFKVLKQFL